MSGRLARVARRLDKSWPLLLLLCAGVLFICLWLLSVIFGFSVLGRLDKASRGDLYSTLSGVTSGLLGFTIAAIAILVAMPRHPSVRFADARKYVVSILLATSLLIVLALIMSLVGLVIDHDRTAPGWLASGLAASIVTAFVGLMLGALGLAVLLNATE